jgi:hypothetical protein
MEKTEITLSFDSERMRAMTIYLKMENSTVQEKMDEAMRELYEKAVPEPVRAYLDIISAPPPKPKRPPRPSQPKAEPPKAPPPPTSEKESGA